MDLNCSPSVTILPTHRYAAKLALAFVTHNVFCIKTFCENFFANIQ